MKQIKKRWLGLAITGALFALFAIASPANAANYSGDCAGISGFNGTGNVTINNTGACSLPNALTATGFIHITSTGAITANSLSGTEIDIATSSGATTTQALTSTSGFIQINSSGALTTQTVTAGSKLTLFAASGNVDTQALTSGGANFLTVNSLNGNVSTGVLSSGGSVWMIADNGTILVNGNLTSNAGGSGGNILLQAGSTIRAGAISTSGGTTTGGVQIDANRNGASTLFRIGNNATNGVTSINTSNTTAGGTNPNFIVGGIQITNGTAGSTGGITVNSMGAINVLSSGSRSGIIHLNAQNGTLTLPTGTLSANGATGLGAGQIILLANTVTTVSGTKVSATQTAAAAATTHGVIIAANTINVAGANGLQVLGNGNAPGAGGAYAALLPKGAVTFSSNDSFNSLFWTVSNISLSTNGPMVVSGLGAPITVSANGTNSQVTISGYPINFNNGAVTITAKGSTANSHRIVMQYTGSFSGTNGLTFSGNGAVTIDSSGTSGNNAAGDIYVLVDQASVLSTVPSFTMNANGLGSGSGALINFQPTKIPTFASPAVNISANGANGQVNFGPWTGTAAGDASITSAAFNLNANARASGTGNAGTIYFGTANLTVGSSTKMKFSSIGPTSGSGNGGNITVFPGNVAGGTLKLGTNVGNLQVLANAGSTGGDGGVLNINPYPGSISIETTDAISAAASTGATANSKGGSVTLIGNPNVSVSATLNGAGINVDGKGNKDGGTIKILGNGTLNLGSAQGSLALSAKATGTGNGGSIEVGYTSTLTEDGEISVSGGSGTNSNGKGGTLIFHSLGTATISGQLTADGAGTGKAGTISVNSAAFNTMNLDGATFSASGDVDGSGNGNSITIANAGPITVDNSTFKVNGGGTGGNAGSTQNGGGISISVDPSAPAVNLTTAKFEAKADFPGNSTGAGGTVQVNKATGTVTSSDPTVGINVPYVINVDGGDGLTPAGFAGSIALNGVTCQQWKTVAATYPQVAWDCITPASGANISTLVSAGASLSSTLQNQLGNLITPPPAAPKVGLFAMTSLVEHEKFFGIPASGKYANQYGISFLNWLRVASTFAQSQGVSNATLSGSPAIMVGALVHELGHHFNVIWGPAGTFRSTQSEWTNLIAPDFATMNGMACNAVFFQQTCDNNVGKTNSEIFSIRFPGIGTKADELFAAMFEHVESLLTGTPVSYQAEPELEKALEAMPQMKSYMSGKIASPPPPAQ